MLEALVVMLMTMQNPVRTYTLEFNHDGVGVESYQAVVDGVRVPITPSCTGTGDARLCTSPLAVTYGVEHTVSVVAVGLFGEATSDPFVCKLPKNPNNPKVGR